jgi:hypothetical protein
VIISGGGQVQRIAVMKTEGITSDALTPEVVAESLDQVMDMSNAQRSTPPSSMADDRQREPMGY